jgi:uracil permease
MVFGLGGAVFSFWNIELGGVGLAAIIGIILNKLLPEKLWWDKNKDESAA